MPRTNAVGTVGLGLAGLGTRVDLHPCPWHSALLRALSPQWVQGHHTVRGLYQASWVPPPHPHAAEMGLKGWFRHPQAAGAVHGEVGQRTQGERKKQGPSWRSPLSPQPGHCPGLLQASPNSHTYYLGRREVVTHTIFSVGSQSPHHHPNCRALPTSLHPCLALGWGDSHPRMRPEPWPLHQLAVSCSMMQAETSPLPISLPLYGLRLAWHPQAGTPGGQWPPRGTRPLSLTPSICHHPQSQERLRARGQTREEADWPPEPPYLPHPCPMPPMLPHTHCWASVPGSV